MNWIAPESNAQPALDELQGVLRRAVEQVRSETIPRESLEQALDRALQLDRPASATGRRLARPMLAAASIAAALMLGIYWWHGQAAPAWALVAQALQAKTWIHFAGETADGQQLEFWFAPARDVSAYRVGRHAWYHDHRMEIYYSYDPQSNTLYRLPETGPAKEHLQATLNTFRALFRGESKLDSPNPDAEVVAQQRRQIVDRGRRWEEYELTLRFPTSPQAKQVMLFRVDAESRLPHALLVTSQGLGRQPEYEVAFDYPNQGPADAYDLGVPRTAKLVDRVPANDLARLFKGVKLARRFFDPYQAVVAEWDQPKNGPESIVTLSLMWRNGKRWRLDRGIPGPGWRPEWRAAKWPSQGDDLDHWVKEQAKEYRFVPWALCDGTAIYIARYSTRDASDEPHFDLVRRLSAGETAETATVPTGVGEHMPECYAYPISLQSSSDQYEAKLDSKPKEGPPNTVLVQGRRTGPRPGPFPFTRFWVDPSRNYLTVRWELLPRPPKGVAVGKDGPVEVEGVTPDVYVLQKLVQSPQGYWYPTEVRRHSTPGKDVKEGEVYQFFVNFKADLPDTLFRLKK